MLRNSCNFIQHLERNNFRYLNNVRSTSYLNNTRRFLLTKSTPLSTANRTLANKSKSILIRSTNILPTNRTLAEDSRPRSLSNNIRDNIVYSEVEDIHPIPKGNIAPFLLKNVHKWETKPALVSYSSGESLSHSEVQDQAYRWNGYLDRAGINVGDVVGYISPNIPCYVPTFIGTGAAGAIFSPVNNNYTAGEMSNQFNICRPKLLVFHNSIEDVVKEALKPYTGDKPKLVSIGNSKGNHPNLNEILTSKDIQKKDPVELSGEETILLPFSSGTTGPPKGTAISHNGFIVNTLQFTHPHSSPTSNATDSFQDVTMGLLPFYHIYGIIAVVAVGIFSGNKIITVKALDPTKFIEIIERHKISVLHTVPSLMNLLKNSPACTEKSMASVTGLLCGAAPVLDSDRDVLLQKMRREVFYQEGYGLTESMISHLTPKGQKKMKNFPNIKLKVINTETGKLLPANEKGEICMHTPARMKYYLNNPEATAAMIKDGWIHTGDIGFYEEDGAINIVDRTKDLIKVKAMQVSPAEVEDVLHSHPLVKEACVIGVPHERLGEAPKAYIVSKENIKENELQDFVAKRLAKHKHLVGGVAFVKELPKTGTGKILRRALREDK